MILKCSLYLLPIRILFDQLSTFVNKLLPFQFMNKSALEIIYEDFCIVLPRETLIKIGKGSCKGRHGHNPRQLEWQHILICKSI